MTEPSEYELVAQRLSGVAETLFALELRVADVERVNARLEQAALTTSRSLEEISRHWNAVYEAMRREEEAIRSEIDEQAMEQLQEEQYERGRSHERLTVGVAHVAAFRTGRFRRRTSSRHRPQMRLSHAPRDG